ncbi:MAG: replication initiator protein A [Clostridiales bacterium]|nr:replication initiator protein A [Clostridiales bacterium]
MKPRASGLAPDADGGAYPFHYGAEADQYTFYRIPKLLFTDPVLKGLSTDAKLLYGLMLDRMELSLKNGWVDQAGRVFIYFSVENIMEMVGCGNAKCTRLLQELDDKNGVGLITRVKQGLGKPDVIYVHKCVSRISKPNVQRFQNDISGDVKTECPEVSKSNTNDTDINHTEFSETYPVFSENRRADAGEMMAERGIANMDAYDSVRRVSERESYRAMVMENIGYEFLVDAANRERLDEIVELMVDTICTTQDYIVIGGDKKPAAVVKSQFCKLNSEHIRFVLDSMDGNTSRVRNIRKYLLAVLYNASMTIDNYYSALVNHDLYGGGG